MAQHAYDLERFSSYGKPKAPPLRVAKNQNRERRAKIWKTLRTLLIVVSVMVMVCGVLYTQATLSELQTAIAEKNREMVEQETLWAHLNFELESKTNIRNIEQRAKELGLEKVNNGQVVYVQIQQDEEIQVKDNGIMSFFTDTKMVLLSIFDFFKNL